MAADTVKTVTIKINGQDAIVDLNEIKKALKETKEAVDKTKDTNLGNFTNQLSNLKEAFKNGEIGAKGLATGVLQVGKAMIMAFITNPILLAIGAIVGAVMVLYNIFKNFKPLVDKIEQAFAGLSAAWNVLKNGIASFISGNKSLSESFTGLGAAMKSAAEEGMRLKKVEQDLEETAAALEVQNAKTSTEVQKLILQSKDRTKSEKERMDLIEKAMKLESAQHDANMKQGQDELDLAFQKMVNGKNLTEEQIKQLKEGGIAAAYDLQNKVQLSDSEIATYKDKLIKMESLNQGHIAIEEKSQNRLNQLADDAKAKSDKIIEDRKKKLQEEADFRKKVTEDSRGLVDQQNAELQKMFDDRSAIEDIALQNSIKKGEEALDETKKIREEQLRIESLVLNDVIDNDKNTYDQRINALKEFINVTNANEKLSNEEKIIETRKINEEILKLEQEKQDQKFEMARMGLETLANLDKAATQGAIALQNQKLKNGKITQEEYDKNVANIQAKAAKREKAYAVAAAVINTAQGVSKALTMAPPLSFILAAATAALGLAQVATILATKVDGGPTTTPASKGISAPDTSTAPNTSFSFAPAEKPASSNQPIKTYVLTKDVQNANQMERAVISNGSI